MEGFVIGSHSIRAPEKIPPYYARNKIAIRASRKAGMTPRQQAIVDKTARLYNNPCAKVSL